MARLLTNLKKVGKNNYTISLLQSRLDNLKVKWTECEAIDVRIKILASKEQQASLPYFANDEFLTAETVFWEVSDYITNAIHERVKPVVTNTTNAAHDMYHDVSQSNSITLPKIPLPTFSGLYTDWLSYRDLFQALVLNRDPPLPKAAQLYFLQTSVKGEASTLVKNIQLSDANFDVAWSKLLDRYENSRHIIDSHLTKWFDISAVTTENVKDLKRLRDQTYDATTSLGNLGRPVDQWDDIITFVTVRKLDPVSRREWEMRIGETKTYPKYIDIHNFLEYRIRALESIATLTSRKSIKPNNDPKTTKSHLSTAVPICECDETHPLHKCEQFKAKSIEERQKFVRSKNLCNDCLASGHATKQCQSKYSCIHCKAKHHSLLHNSNFKKNGRTEKLNFSPTGESFNKNNPVAASTRQASPSGKNEAPSTSQHVTSSVVKALHASETKLAPATVMLATAWVLVSSPNGRKVRVRALLDQGSQSSFVTESIAHTLRAPRIKVRAPVSGIGGTAAGIGRAIVQLKLNSCINTENEVQCTAIVFSKLTSYVPQRSQCKASWRHLEGLEMADPEPSSGDAIQLILGADVYANILREGLRRGPIGSPIAQKTTLGWILSGPTTSGTSSEVATLTALLANEDTSLQKQLRSFWELEDIPKCSPLNEEELACEAHFAATHKRLPDGKYSVRLPFKGVTPINIGSSSHTAAKWLEKLQRKFTREPDLIEQYYDFMTEYIRLQHMVPTTFNAPDSTPAVFLPHHPVIKDSSTTRLRVVFNASSKTSNGTSLNDHMMVGPKLQSDLPSIILRWRQHQFALTADITKMYRQILVDPEDQRYQQILWKLTPDAPVTPYKLVTVTYGTASAPFLAMRVLKQLADDEELKFPQAASIVRDNFYVDDVLFGANDPTVANQLRKELEELLTRGGFTLRKWMSSHKSLLDKTPESDQEKTKMRSFDSTESVKILGIGWVPTSDSFCFNALEPTRSKNTKRSVLSITAQLFDPLGWLSPVIICAKIFMQELWIAALDWDDELSPEHSEKWNDYCRRLPELQAISIPRWNHLENNKTSCELHGFADASTRAYAAVVYLRTTNQQKEVNISLLTAKSKVAPIKTISVPRLELCAAVLLAKLLEFVQKATRLQSCTTYAWTDSTVVRAWLKQHPSEWPTFVANRVATIQHRLPDITWRHVPTKQNPADCASRGLNATELISHSLWWQGPPWLKQDHASWPVAPKTNPEKDLLLNTSKQVVAHVTVKSTPAWDLCNNISSWKRLLRVTAYIWRFINHCRRQKYASEVQLSGNEIRNAQTFWINQVQREAFQQEIETVNQGQAPSRKSALKGLTPFLDDKMTLRVGGRLERSNLTFEEKHPAILPKHRISSLIVEDAHLRCLHGGPLLTISLLRQQYWIIGHRPFVRNAIRKCVPCARERAQVPTQIMGNLPAARAGQTQRAFLHTGLDYTGPVLVRSSKGRGYKAHKAYLAVFVCMSTRAIHLELVSDYTSESFIAAYRRFTARRGLPTDIYSDNGTTFQGAETELQSAFNNAVNDPNIGNTVATDGTNWHFIPPGAPHFGGLWEAGVKSAKHHLKQVIGAHTLTYEEFNTLITQIEACLNSRPIGPQLTDPSEFSALTPGHLLIGAPLLSIPEPTLLNLNENRLSRWQLVQQMLESFWKRWSVEYFHSLQVRTKWTKAGDNITVGQLVLVRNNNLPPAKWMLGKITNVHPGSDSHVRVVTIRTAQSEFKRPISQICLLPVHSDINQSSRSLNDKTPDSTDTSDFQDCETLDPIILSTTNKT